MVRANRRITLEEIEDGLNEDCSHFSVHKIVSETLGYRKVSARWVDKWLKEAAGESYNTGITNFDWTPCNTSRRDRPCWTSTPRPAKPPTRNTSPTRSSHCATSLPSPPCRYCGQNHYNNQCRKQPFAADNTLRNQGSLQILLDFKVDDQLYSDHHPLVLTIKGQNFNEKKTKREDYNITRYRWSADGFAMFKMKLEELREKNIPASDDLVYTFNQRILEAMSSAKITYSIKGGPRKSKPWFDKDCYDMKKLAKESLKKYRKTNRLEDRECYASSRKKYLALLDLKRKGFDNEKQEILRNAKDSKTFWKTIALYKSTSIIQGEISIQDWLNFYRELMTTEKNLRICNLHNVISQNDPILDSEITNADIYKEIAGLRSNKACGPDGIPNEVLKTLPDSYILLLKQLYNSVMTTGKYPAIWTNSPIHPIFKNGYKNSPSNYREFGDIHLLLYADDIAIIGESRMNLQKKIKILKEYLDENLMTLNESKSKIMVFRNGGETIRDSSKVRLLNPRNDNCNFDQCL
ncbi:hypothetical protein LAZ67_17002203 [Cordylochernes scorpioides]|uniref:Reverse transcriptase domain-containing protein n=1 Tax=Cordylochernes scorpioides TaxID=51811 RepID=A0ABY6LF80_9ARAC|nr:hypothetical protein LAZ67_17002203 [Cordylochernes scorpioides]